MGSVKEAELHFLEGRSYYYGNEVSMQSTRRVSKRQPCAQETVEPQEWGARRCFRGRNIVEERAGAFQAANGWRHRDTVWTDGSRLYSAEVGAACMWRGSGLDRWAGRHFHLGSNKEVFDARDLCHPPGPPHPRPATGERPQIYCLCGLDGGHRQRIDTIGPGQRFAASMEVCSLILNRDSEVTIRRVSAHNRITGNEKADEYTT